MSVKLTGLPSCVDTNEFEEIDSEPDIDSIVNSIHIPDFSYEKIKSTITFYVDNCNPIASDNNDGSVYFPWLTIAHATQFLGPGVEIIVNQGTYNERVTIKKGGTDSKYAIFRANGNVEMKGFSLLANNVAIENFTIHGSSGIKGWRNGGIWIGASNLYINGNNIKGYTSGTAIDFDWSATAKIVDVVINNNLISNCNKGVSIFGKNIVVDGNRITHLVRDDLGGDADYIRFFGDTIIIRDNLFYGTQLADIGESHVDIFQSFDSNNNPHFMANNILVQGNMCLGFFHQGLMIESKTNSHSNIIVYNNVFTDSEAWGVCAFGINGIHVINNTFINGNLGIGFRDGNARIPTTGLIVNNIIYNYISSYYADTYSHYFSGKNLLVTRDYPEDDNMSDICNEDPLFLNPPKEFDNEKNKREYYLGADNLPFTIDDGLNLRDLSPALEAGINMKNIGAY